MSFRDQKLAFIEQLDFQGRQAVQYHAEALGLQAFGTCNSAEIFSPDALDCDGMLTEHHTGILIIVEVKSMGNHEN